MLALSFAVWIILNGRVDGEIVLFGLLVAGVAWLFAKGSLGWSLKKEMCFYRLMPMAVHYLLVLVKEIVVSSVSVAGYVLAGTDPEGVMVEFSSGLRTPVANAILANSITLTPGTITVREKGGRLLVCCLAPKYREGIEQLVFTEHLRRMETACARILGEEER